MKGKIWHVSNLTEGLAFVPLKTVFAFEIKKLK